MNFIKPLGKKIVIQIIDENDDSVIIAPEAYGESGKYCATVISVSDEVDDINEGDVVIYNSDAKFIDFEMYSEEYIILNTDAIITIKTDDGYNAYGSHIIVDPLKESELGKSVILTDGEYSSIFGTVVSVGSDITSCSEGQVIMHGEDTLMNLSNGRDLYGNFNIEFKVIKSEQCYAIAK